VRDHIAHGRLVIQKHDVEAFIREDAIHDHRRDMALRNQSSVAAG
jgi:hypothetical protein